MAAVAGNGRPATRFTNRGRVSRLAREGFRRSGKMFLPLDHWQSERSVRMDLFHPPPPSPKPSDLQRREGFGLPASPLRFIPRESRLEVSNDAEHLFVEV